MAVNSNTYLGTAQNRGPSPIVWGDFDVVSVIENPDLGVYYFNDFIEDLSGWTKTQATAGTAAVDTDETYGGLILDAGSSTADQGIQVQSANLVVPAANTKHYFGVRAKFANNTVCQFFAGFADDDTTVIASGENSTANHIGFEKNATSIAADSDGLYFYSESGGTRTTVATVGTLTDATYVTLEFVVTGTDLVEMYVDGVKFATTVTTNIPTANMALTLVCQTEGTSQPTVTLDWLRYGHKIDHHT